VRRLGASIVLGIVACGGGRPEPANVAPNATSTESAPPLAESAPAERTLVPARELALRSSGFDGPRGWVLGQNGYVGTYVRLDRAGVLRVVARASGHPDAGVPPELSIVVADGSTKFQLAESARDYEHAAKLPAGTYFVRLELTNGAPNTTRELMIESVAVQGAALLPRSTDELALAAANTYIEHFRRGRALIRLPRSVRPGTLVKVSLKRPAFSFGTNIPGATNRMLPKPVPPGSEAEKFQSLVLGRFDTVVLSNGGKWTYHEPIRDKVELAYVDRFLEFANEHELRARMHTMLWDTVQEPPWVASDDPRRPGLLTRAHRGDERAKAELRAEISERIEHYAGSPDRRYHELDLLNESVHKKRYLETYGERGIAEIFGETKRALERARFGTRLCLNEYNLLQWSTDPRSGASDPYANWYLWHADALRREGAPIDILGVQYYADGRDAAAIGSNVHSAARIVQVLQNLSVGGRRLVLTEFEVRGGTANHARGADILEETMRLAFGTANVDSFLVWAIWAAAASTPEPASILFEKNGSITETGRRYDALRAAWSTHLEIPVAPNGTLDFTGFCGSYTLSIDGKEREFVLEKGNHEYGDERLLPHGAW
jgi:GH35 family endo-1,4-beta-xylanase